MIHLAKRFLLPAEAPNHLSASELLDALGREISWIADLEKTPQDPEWHAEGNVRIHTEMVLEEIKPIATNEFESVEHQTVLVLAAALHDIGKTVTTCETEIDGRLRVTSRRHPAIGRNHIAPRLLESELTDWQRHQLLGLVGHHHDPKRLVRNDARASRFARLSRAVDSDLVHALERADLRGRHCPDREEQLEVLEYFRIACEEAGTWNRDVYSEWETRFRDAGLTEDAFSYVYCEGQCLFEEGKIHSPEEALGKTYAHRTEHPRLILMCGPSGSGKSTWIEQHASGYELISLDDLREELTGTQKRGNQKTEGRIIQEALERLRVVLRKKGKVVWDATALRRDGRAKIVSLCRDYHAFTRIVIVAVPEATALRQNRSRMNPVPDDVILNHYRSWEWPEPWEAHWVEWIAGN